MAPEVTLFILRFALGCSYLGFFGLTALVYVLSRRRHPWAWLAWSVWSLGLLSITLRTLVLTR